MRKFVLGSTLLAFALSYAPFALSEELETLATPSTKDTTVITDTTEKSMDKTSYTKTIANGQYIGGGVVAIFFGWGIGHAIQGRWNDTGWIFTVGKAVFVGGAIPLFLSTSWRTYTGGDFYGLVGLGVAYYALWLWEIIDAWNLPSHYTIVKTPKLQISPVYTANYRDISTSGLGLSLKYSFF